MLLLAALHGAGLSTRLSPAYGITPLTRAAGPALQTDAGPSELWTRDPQRSNSASSAEERRRQRLAQAQSGNANGAVKRHLPAHTTRDPLYPRRGAADAAERRRQRLEQPNKANVQEGSKPILPRLEYASPTARHPFDLWTRDPRRGPTDALERRRLREQQQQPQPQLAPAGDVDAPPQVGAGEDFDEGTDSAAIAEEAAGLDAAEEAPRVVASLTSELCEAKQELADVKQELAEASQSYGAAHAADRAEAPAPLSRLGRLHPAALPAPCRPSRRSWRWQSGPSASCRRCCRSHARMQHVSHTPPSSPRTVDDEGPGRGGRDEGRGGQGGAGRGAEDGGGGR